jgi:hypothetical protein
LTEERSLKLEKINAHQALALALVDSVAEDPIAESVRRIDLKKSL